MPFKYVKYNKHKHKETPWITNGIIKSIKYRDNLYKMLKQKPPGSQEFLNSQINLRTYNKILWNSIRTAKKSYYNSCFQKYSSNIKKTWSTINHILNKNAREKQFPSHFVHNNRVITDKKKIANSLMIIL